MNYSAKLFNCRTTYCAHYYNHPLRSNAMTLDTVVILIIFCCHLLWSTASSQLSFMLMILMHRIIMLFHLQLA